MSNAVKDAAVIHALRDQLHVSNLRCGMLQREIAALRAEVDRLRDVLIAERIRNEHQAKG